MNTKSHTCADTPKQTQYHHNTKIGLDYTKINADYAPIQKGGKMTLWQLQLFDLPPEEADEPTEKEKQRERAWKAIRENRKKERRKNEHPEIQPNPPPVDAR